MKRPKDRLHRVIVIGATPAGIAATNKLGEIGIPVTLIDTHNDLDHTLSLDQWRLDSGVTFNYAHRPGLIRILRNPSIQCIMPAEVKSVKHNAQGFTVRVKKIPSYVDPDRCTLCGRCSEVCPVTTPDGFKAIRLNSRMGLPGRPMIDKRKKPLCQESCPLGVNAQGYIALTLSEKFEEALTLVRKDNVLPGICGRICTHPCEADCRRGELDEPIAIKDIKRFLADVEPSLSKKEDSTAPDMPEKEHRSEKIAVIGSGPSGLAAAADLARNGFARGFLAGTAQERAGRSAGHGAPAQGLLVDVDEGGGIGEAHGVADEDR
jgi:heterodisulfide reductase subunit A-like polyferredoxin